MFLGSTRLETIQNLHSESAYLTKLKRVVKVVRPDNGLREKPKCLLNNTNRKVAVTVTNKFNLDDFRITPEMAQKLLQPVAKHSKTCLVFDGGYCSCGLEEVLEDEAMEELV
jgi:hypothetical protein